MGKGNFVPVLFF